MPDTRNTSLGPLPADWAVRRLSDLVEKQSAPVDVIPAERYREIGIRSHGKGIFHKEPVKGSELGDKRVFWVKPNCLAFNIVFAWEGAVAVTRGSEEGMIASHRFPMMRPRNGSGVNVEYLRRFFQTPLGVRLLGRASPGGAGRNRTLNQKFLGDITVPVPSLGEQEKIAAILSSVDDAIETTQAVIDQLQVVKKAMMAELLTRGLPGRHTRFKQTEIGEVPEGWEVRRVADMGEVQLGRMRSPVYSTGTMRPYLRVANVLDGEIKITDVLEMPFEDEQFEKFRLRHRGHPFERRAKLGACRALCNLSRRAPRLRVSKDSSTLSCSQKRRDRICPTSLSVVALFWALRRTRGSDDFDSTSHGSKVRGNENACSSSR